MTAVSRLLFRQPYSVRTPLQIVSWWESRRPAYNVAIGSAGLLTLAVCHLVAALPPVAMPIPLLPSLAVAGAYGVMANVCYTLGWMAELVVRRHSGDELEALGAALFRYGLAFSVGLTLFPIGLMVMMKVLWVGATVFS